MGVGLVTGKELRVLRALRRGPLYEGSFGLVLAMPLADVRKQLRALQRQGYVTAKSMRVSAPTWELTESGREIVEAMTP
jgi:DNA-binding MarR family transcriptional regulator